jgi:cytochrome b subunit of formate dehydrogenase
LTRCSARCRGGTTSGATNSAPISRGAVSDSTLLLFDAGSLLVLFLVILVILFIFVRGAIILAPFAVVIEQRGLAERTAWASSLVIVILLLFLVLLLEARRKKGSLYIHGRACSL